MPATIVAAAYLVLSIAATLDGVSSSREETQLIDSLGRLGLSRFSHPVERARDAVVVSVAMNGLSLLDVSADGKLATFMAWLSQKWNVSQLQWDPTKYGDIETLVLPTEWMWLPDITPYDVMHLFKKRTDMADRMAVSNEGHVTYDLPIEFGASCTDGGGSRSSLRCSARFGTLASTVNQVDLVHRRTSLYTDTYCDWSVTSSQLSRDVGLYATSAPFVELSFVFHLSKRGRRAA